MKLLSKLFAKRPTRQRPAARRRFCVWFEQFESRSMLTGIPYGATTTDTAEYMLGDVFVSVVLLESTGPSGSTNSENWTPSAINQVKNNITTGLQWWVDTLHNYHPNAYLNFQIDFQYADTPFEVSGYEPINNTSDQHIKFVQDFLTAHSNFQVGGDVNAGIFTYNNAQRIAHNTDWAYTIFVVNDLNDIAVNGDGKFAFGGSFEKSFAYPGGRYVVTLADRPSEIVAHETGHIFWAADEYSSGDSYFDTRGYYNTQNTNGAAGAPSGFQQQDSLMASNSRLVNSYLNKTLPASTRGLIGWKDSDSDGIIDVLDVPLTLSGDGYRDASGNYRFIGQSKVQTLPNTNKWATAQSDITINRVRVAEYRIDGGSWTTAANPNTYVADLDLTIPLPAGDHTIQIRTRDTLTGVTSAIFSASTQQPAAMTPSGINGFIWDDRDSDGVWDASEKALGSRTVQLVTSGGQLLAGPQLFDPSNYAELSTLNNAFSGVQVAATGTGTANNLVAAVTGTFGATSSRVFANYGTNGSRSTSWDNKRKLEITFTTPVSAVSIDAIAKFDGSYGRLEIYDAANNLLGRFTSSELALGAVQKLTMTRPQADIKYAVAYGSGGTVVALDNLLIGPEVTTTANARGAFSFPSLAAGTYYVKAIAPTEWAATNPANGVQQVSLVNGQPLAHVDFGQHSTTITWQNTQFRFDVNSDGAVTPLDALLVIIDLNANGPRLLNDPPPSGETPPNFIDVNGDGSVSPLDALEVVIYLNAGGGSEPPTSGGSGSSGGSSSSGGGGGAPPQGESIHQADLQNWVFALGNLATEHASIQDEALLATYSSPQVAVSETLPLSISAQDAAGIWRSTSTSSASINSLAFKSLAFGDAMRRSPALSKGRASRVDTKPATDLVDVFEQGEFEVSWRAEFSTPATTTKSASPTFAAPPDDSLWQLLAADVAAATAARRDEHSATDDTSGLPPGQALKPPVEQLTSSQPANSNRQSNADNAPPAP